jgi:hypothetical protein
MLLAIVRACMNPADRSSGAMGCEHLKLHDKSIAIGDHCQRERESSGTAILTTFGRPPYLAPRCCLPPPLAATRAHYTGGSHHAPLASGRRQPSLPRPQPVDSPNAHWLATSLRTRRAGRGTSHAFFLSARCSRPGKPNRAQPHRTRLHRTRCTQDVDHHTTYL